MTATVVTTSAALSKKKSQICVRREALALFGLREDELLPDLHITRDGVLRIGLVKVRVTRSRMTLLLRWRLMQNSMSLCKLRMLQWARTFMTKKISLGRSTANFRKLELVPERWPLARLSFLYKNVWTTLTEYWLGVAGKSMQHV